jgi:type IV pilus assembly protein PilE
MELRGRNAGFTLIELMIVVVIATILLSIAIPSYLSQVRESRRTEAKTALLDLAGREESYFSTNGSQYTNLAANLGYTGWTAGNSPNGYYTITVACIAAAGGGLACDPNANAPNGPSYYLTATPVGTQANDTQCGTFAVDSLGNQFTTGTLPSAQCWAH